MKQINLKLITVLIFYFNFQSAWGINCNKAHLKWELTVCQDEELLSLDVVMNDDYLKDIKVLENRDYIKKTQKKWLKDMATRTDILEINEAYSKRITTLRNFYFDAKRISITGPLVKNSEIPYRWETIIVDKEKIIKYPVLETSNSFESRVKSRLNEIAMEYLDYAKKAYGCTLPNGTRTNVFEMSVFSNSNKLFGLAIDFDSCFCGCNYPIDHHYTYLWDLEKGWEIQEILDHPLILEEKDKKYFWQKIAESQYISLDNLRKKDDCIKEYNNPKFYLHKDNIKVSNYEDSGWQRFCSIEYTITYSELAAFHLKINQFFLSYLPRFIKAGLINENIGKQLFLQSENSKNIIDKIQPIDLSELNITKLNNLAGFTLPVNL